VAVLTYLYIAQHIVQCQSSLTNDQTKACPPNLSGPDCTIPYEDCGDGHRQCFNNSRCVRNNQRDKLTGEYGFNCDCSFAEEVSKFAGHECEHSVTDLCPEDAHIQHRGENGVQGRHFCTNGGLCGEYVYRAQVHAGCYCPRDYAGAHCQYLKVAGGFDDVVGQDKLEDVGDNFYVFTPQPTKSNSLSVAVIGMVVGVLITLALAVMKGLGVRRNGGRFKVIDAKLSDDNDGGDELRLTKNEAEII
jgi:hypothetical protein